MRALIALLVLSAVATLAPSPAGAQAGSASNPECVPSPAPDEYICNGVAVTVRPGQRPPAPVQTTPPGTGATGVSTPGRTVRYVAYDRLASTSDGTACVTIGYAPEGVTPTDAAPGPTLTYEYEYFPPCPATVGTPAPPADAAPGTPAVTPSYLAAQFWERARLPAPTPYIAPGRAITGKLGYLETRGTTSSTLAEDTVLGRLEVMATGRYYVNWATARVRDRTTSKVRRGRHRPSPTTGSTSARTRSW